MSSQETLFELVCRDGEIHQSSPSSVLLSLMPDIFHIRVIGALYFA